MGYNFTATWVKGLKNAAPDTLSRHPVHDQLMHLLNWAYTIILTCPLQKYGPSVTNIMKACTCKSCANMPNKMISTNYCGTSH